MTTAETLARKQYVHALLTHLGEEHLSLGHIFVNRSNTGSIVFFAGKVVGLHIPEKYMFGDIDVLTALVAHEYAHVWLNYGRMDEWEARLAGYTKGYVREAVRILFEFALFGWRRMLKRKMFVDRWALILLRDKGLPVTGYLPLLQEHYIDAAAFPFFRRITRRYVMRKRIEYAEQFLRSLG